jgi:Fe-S-cluster-containing hydrogenase component 2
MLNKLPNDSNDGILTLKRKKEIPGYPGEEAFEKGSTVVVECDEDIPCNPCEDICKKGAITVGNPITNLPKVDPNKCNGCALCVTICPGLCIFVVNKNYTDTESLIYIPFELSPLPEKNQIVKGCNQKGEQVCDARVEKVIKPKKINKTAIIAVAVPKEFYGTVRNISF